ncbi:unnamed protein product, partial [Didymodactylos carnosus]
IRAEGRVIPITNERLKTLVKLHHNNFNNRWLVHEHQTETKNETKQKRYDQSLIGTLLLIPSDPSEIFDYLEQGNFEALRKTFEIHHAKVVKMKNTLNQTLLHVAVKLNLAYVWIRLFLLQGVDPCAQDISGRTTAHYVCERGDVEMLKALILPFHPKIKSLPDNLAEQTHKNCMTALTVVEKNGLTPFMEACLKKSSKCVKFLHEQYDVQIHQQ